MAVEKRIPEKNHRIHTTQSLSLFFRWRRKPSHSWCDSSSTASVVIHLSQMMVIHRECRTFCTFEWTHRDPGMTMSLLKSLCYTIIMDVMKEAERFFEVPHPLFSCLLSTLCLQMSASLYTFSVYLCFIAWFLSVLSLNCWTWETRSNSQSTHTLHVSKELSWLKVYRTFSLKLKPRVDFESPLLLDVKDVGLCSWASEGSV